MRKEEIVIIDDEPIALFILTKMLSRLCPGMRVSGFHNPQEALGLLDSSDHPCVIFLDLNMPVFSGWDILEKMKNKGYKGDVVMLTSSISNEDRVNSEKWDNVKGYLVKPVTLEELKEQLQTLKCIPA